jgi:hypothetical protein
MGVKREERELRMLRIFGPNTEENCIMRGF